MASMPFADHRLLLFPLSRLLYVPRAVQQQQPTLDPRPSQLIDPNLTQGTTALPPPSQGGARSGTKQQAQPAPTVHTHTHTHYGLLNHITAHPKLNRTLQRTSAATPHSA